MKYEITYKKGQEESKEIIEASKMKVVNGYLYL
jgi:hypothetical protein